MPRPARSTGTTTTSAGDASAVGRRTSASRPCRRRRPGRRAPRTTSSTLIRRARRRNSSRRRRGDRAARAACRARADDRPGGPARRSLYTKAVRGATRRAARARSAREGSRASATAAVRSTAECPVTSRPQRWPLFCVSTGRAPAVARPDPAPTVSLVVTGGTVVTMDPARRVLYAGRRGHRRQPRSWPSTPRRRSAGRFRRARDDRRHRPGGAAGPRQHAHPRRRW